jgi:hypothetical protein
MDLTKQHKNTIAYSEAVNDLANEILRVWLTCEDLTSDGSYVAAPEAIAEALNIAEASISTNSTAASPAEGAAGRALNRQSPYSPEAEHVHQLIRLGDVF